MDRTARHHIDIRFRHVLSCSNGALSWKQHWYPSNFGIDRRAPAKCVATIFRLEVIANNNHGLDNYTIKPLYWLHYCQVAMPPESINIDIASAHSETTRLGTCYAAERKQNPYAGGIRKSAEAVMCCHFQAFENVWEVETAATDFLMQGPERPRCQWHPAAR